MEKIVLRYRKKGYTQTQLEAAALAFAQAKGLEDSNMMVYNDYEEIAVFGDDLNDLEMISAYPVSIAMGNAVEEVKSAAKYTTLPNDEGGIVHALKNILHII